MTERAEGGSDALPRSVSVLMPIYQGAALLERLLDALASQATSFPWEFVALDCGSTDGTLGILHERAKDFPVPLRVEHLGRERFDHGDSRNLLAALGTGELLVFLTDDAIPARPDWLETLRANFADPQVGAAYCRNLPRPDASLLAQVATDHDPYYSPLRREHRMPDRESYLALDPEGLRGLYALNDTASATRRSLWERHPYPRSMGGEDVLMARGLVEAGYAIVYDEKACVLHSHDWPAERIEPRARLDGEFNAEWLGRVCVGDEAEGAAHVEIGAARDRASLRRAGMRGEELEREAARAHAVRLALFRGLLEGGKTTRRRRPTAMLESSATRALLVASSDAAHAVELALALGARGMQVVLAARGPRGWQVAGRSIDAPREELPLEAASAALHGEPQLLHLLDEPETLGAEAWSKAARHLPAIVWRGEGWRILPGGLRAEPPKDAPNESTDFIGYRVAPEFGDPGVTMEREALQWRFRYRALLCRAGPVLLERWGRELTERRGRTRLQGTVDLLLGPGPASVEIDLDERPPGEWEVELRLHLLVNEFDLRMGGRVLGDGEKLVRFGPIHASGRDQVVPLFIRLPEGVRRLRIDNSGQRGQWRMLRINKLVVRRGGVPTPAERAWKEREGAVRVVDAKERIRAKLQELALPDTPRPRDEELPEVAVVMATLVGKRFLQRSLASIFASDYPRERIRVVVVDNASPPSTGSWLKRAYPQVAHLRNRRNVGFTMATRQGAFAAAGAPVLVFLNDDLVIEPDCLRELVAPVARGECAATAARMLDLASGQLEFLGGGANLQGVAISLIPGEDELPLVPRRALFPCGGATAIDAGAFHDVGGFDPELFAYYDDLDLGWRLWLAGYEVHSAPRAVVRHARSSTSRRFAPEMVRLLQTRNALLCCVKNYGEEAFEKLLPCLIALHARRAHVMSLPFQELPFRIEYAKRDARSRLRARLRKKTVEVPRMAVADWLALNDVIGNLEHWLNRRAGVQSLRRRPDGEILPLFLDPLRCLEGEGGYVALQRVLTERFGLDELFR